MPIPDRGRHYSDPDHDSRFGESHAEIRPERPIEHDPALVPARVSHRFSGRVQSGPAHSNEWVVEFEPHAHPGVEPLMGWISSADPLQQVRLNFNSLEEAVAYCQRNKLAYAVEKPPARRRQIRTYADNYLPFPDGSPRDIYPH